MMISDPGCQFPGCGAASDGELDGEPFCLDHADLVVDRWAAICEYPNVAYRLTPLLDR